MLAGRFFHRRGDLAVQIGPLPIFSGETAHLTQAPGSSVHLVACHKLHDTLRIAGTARLGANDFQPQPFRGASLPRPNSPGRVEAFQVRSR